MRLSSLFSSLVLAFALIVLTSCGGGDSGGGNDSPGPGPGPTPSGPQVTLTPSATTIAPGEVVTLTWTSSAVESIAISPDPFEEDDGTPGTSGVITVKPPCGGGCTQPTPVTYTITGTGASGTATATATATVTVDPNYPTLAFAASPSNIISGQSTKLIWSTTHVSSVSIDNGIGTVAHPGGDTIVVSPTATTTYTATATGANGITRTAQATVTLPGANQVSVALKATPAAVASGASSKLEWFSQNAASLSIDNGVGSVGQNGNVSVSPGGTTTYTITATDASGNKATSAATVTVSTSGDPNKLKHVIIMMQENRSLDNYFGMLDTYRQMKGVGGTFDGLPKNPDGSFAVAIPDLNGTPTAPYHLQTVCTDNSIPSWNQSFASLNNGAMDGFLQKTPAATGDPAGHRSIGYYDWTDLPYYYDLATTFATSDRQFGSLLGPTVPNRMYLFTGTSFGHIHSDPPPPEGFSQLTIWQRLREQGVTYRIYYQDNTVFLAQFNNWEIDKSFVYPISSYFEDIKHPETLPQVLFIERGSVIENDEHPLNNIQVGATFVKSTIDALMASPSWSSSAYILVYDEAGGLYDHVPPYSVALPDDIAPLKDTGDAPGTFDRSGFRVPIVVVSPFARANFVSHVNREHTSLLKLIEARFGIAPLTRRDAEADNMFEFFDFDNPPFANPPAGLSAQPTNGVCDKTKQAETGP
jgi:phospholipase C